MAPRISIILLNWNGWKDTIECLESLYQINYPNYDVVLVDNASTDESLARIRDYCDGKIKIQSEFFKYDEENKPIKVFEFTKETSERVDSQQESDTHQKSHLHQKNHPRRESDPHENTLPENYFNFTSNERLILIKNDENYGFAEGNNVGMRFALKVLNPDYVLLLNNDTVVDQNFLTELVNLGETDEKIGFVGPKTYFYSQPKILQVAGGAEVDLRHGLIHEIGSQEMDDGSFDDYYEPDYIGGACILAKKELIDTIGLLDSNFFMYWEDNDWCFSGREHGYKCAYAFKSRIWHKYGAASEDYFKMYYLTRNRLYFMRKHTKRGQYALFLAYFVPNILFECLYQLIRKRDVKMYDSYSRGLVDGFKLKRVKK